MNGRPLLRLSGVPIRWSKGRTLIRLRRPGSLRASPRLGVALRLGLLSGLRPRPVELPAVVRKLRCPAAHGNGGIQPGDNGPL